MLAGGLSHGPNNCPHVLKTHSHSPLVDSRLPLNAACSRTWCHRVATIARGWGNVGKTQTIERDTSACCWGLNLAKNPCLLLKAQQRMANLVKESSGITCPSITEGKEWSVGFISWTPPKTSALEIQIILRSAWAQWWGGKKRWQAGKVQA